MAKCPSTSSRVRLIAVSGSQGHIHIIGIIFFVVICFVLYSFARTYLGPRDVVTKVYSTSDEVGALQLKVKELESRVTSLELKERIREMKHTGTANEDEEK